MQIMLKAIPAKHMNIAQVRDKIHAALKAVGEDFQSDYHKTTATWQHKPGFDLEQRASTSQELVQVTTDDEIFGYVELGTADHFVPKSGAATMAFQPGYGAKTSPGVIGSSGGGASGGQIVRRGRWKVRGIKARHFSEAIVKTRKAGFEDAIETAIRRGAEQIY